MLSETAPYRRKRAPAPPKRPTRRLTNPCGGDRPLMPDLCAGLRWRPRRSHAPGGPVNTAIFDADSHLMETPEWLGHYADDDVRDRLAPLGFGGAGSGAAELMAGLPELW